MKIELGDWGMLNHITIIPLTTIILQGKQYDCRVMSWILACINSDIIDLVISFTTTAHELWTWIRTLYRPISLPLVNEPIQRDVAKGRNIRDTEGKINLSIFGIAPATTIVVATEAYNGSPFKIVEESEIKGNM